MAQYGYAPLSIAMVRKFHDGEYSEPFLANRVKQGCVMAPTLFRMIFYSMLTDTF